MVTGGQKCPYMVDSPPFNNSRKSRLLTGRVELRAAVLGHTIARITGKVYRLRKAISL